eukprot:TRINITY_DN13099_c0_g1_i1.p1 TRINITY_DN13099_c0_g1~~TRINITY_DN13099_c0_g1_i1.p1  ORF type:complete len:307 (+),score=121.50 TRINITY_DN13099_c0_g1_i1:139-921(+)
MPTQMQSPYPPKTAAPLPGDVDAPPAHPSVWDIEAQIADGRAPMVSGIEGEVRAYLQHVYLLLTGLCTLAAVGCFLQIQLRVHPLVTGLLSIGLFFYVYCTRDQGMTKERIGAFGGFGLCTGVSLGPLIQLALFVNAKLILVALGLTAGVFLCFTMAARYAKRRSFLYLGGLLGSCIMGLLVCALLQIFFNWPILRSAQLYGGLVVFSLYVTYDTQKMIEKAHLGARDHLFDALELFIDLVAIFRRILIILLQNSARQSD